jgi:molybdopterin converting factor small subunit
MSRQSRPGICLSRVKPRPLTRNNQETTAMIHVTRKFLGPFRTLVSTAIPDGAEQLELPPGARLSEALQSTALPPDAPRVVLLNGVQHEDDPQLGDGDVITVFPPIAGGCPEKICRN